ncbi:MAG TPA: hypothetical protein VKU85_00175 [bacterium]|nr:hypothetical protein [bacterium]
MSRLSPRLRLPIAAALAVLVVAGAIVAARGLQQAAGELATSCPATT